MNLRYLSLSDCTVLAPMEMERAIQEFNEMNFWNPMPEDQAAEAYHQMLVRLATGTALEANHQETPSLSQHQQSKDGLSYQSECRLSHEPAACLISPPLQVKEEFLHNDGDEHEPSPSLTTQPVRSRAMEKISFF